MTKDEALKLALEALDNAWLDSSMMGRRDVARHTEAITAIREALMQPQQEPVARIDTEPAWDGALGLYRAEVTLTKKLRQFSDLYTSPPARKPLTDEEIDEAWKTSEGWRGFARAIEAAHGIKEST